MSKTVASTDISILDFSVLLDLSTYIPTAKVTNLSTVVNANNLQWIFEFYSPSGTPIHVGLFSAPDIDSIAFTDFSFSEQIPKIFSQVEFSQSNQYVVKVSVKDGAGNIFDLSKGASLCKPNGNNGKNNFGAADIDVETKCSTGQLLVTDKTNLIYKSVVGNKVSSTVELTYPKDPDGNVLSPITVNSIPALLPIKYEGDGNEVYVVHIYDYDLGDYFTVRIRYSFTKVFGVWCNVTLQPLFCEIDKIVSVLEKDCFDTQENNDQHKKLNLVNTKMLKAHTGMVQPLSGYDVPAIVEDIKSLLGIECDCTRPAGISNVGNALVTDAIFTANKVCGDMLLTWSNDGLGNITLNYQNSSYTFIISPDTGNSAAFQLKPTVVGCNKETALFVNIEMLSTEILTEIQNNPTLLNILNSITQKAQLTCSGLDGGAAFNLGTCDYSIEIDTSISGKTFNSILIGSTSYPAPSGTLITSAATIQTFLNALGLGTFVVVYSSLTNKTTITSAANPNHLSTVTTAIGVTNTVTQFNSNCGLICNLLQLIFNYLNAINLIQVKAGVGMTICSFKTDGSVDSKTFLDTDTASSISVYMANSFCNIVNYIKDKLVTCSNLRGLFAAMTTEVINSADTVPMWVAGKCVEVPLKELAKSIFTLLLTDTDVKSIYCLVSPCATVSSCSPVTGLSGSGGDTSWNFIWSTVAGAIGYKWSIDGVNWFSVTSTAAFVPTLTADTAYTFRVYPVYPSGDGSSCVITSVFTTTNTGVTCAAPASLTLTDQTLNSFNATWTAVPGATAYQYRLNGGAWINIGNIITMLVSPLSEGTLYNFEIRAVIGGVACVASINDSIATLYNYSISGGYGFTITSVTGTGVPTLPSSLSVPQFGHHTGISGSLSVTLTGTIVTTTKLIVYVNGVQYSCVAVPAAGTFGLSCVALVTDIVSVNVNSGTC